MSCSRRKLTYQAENRTFSGSLGIERKSQGVLMQRILAWISAAWICSRETKAEGQPSPSCAVGKQRLSGQHTVELLDLLSRITSSKKKKSKLTNKKEIGMKYGWVPSASIYWNTIVWAWLCQFHRTHRTTQSVLHCVMCKRLTSAWPKETLIKEAPPRSHQFSRGHLAGRSRLTTSWSRFVECRPNSGMLFLCCYQTLFI